MNVPRSFFNMSKKNFLPPAFTSRESGAGSGAAGGEPEWNGDMATKGKLLRAQLYLVGSHQHQIRPAAPTELR